MAKQTDAPDPLAAALMQLQLDWVEQQFRAMGRPDPRDLAVQLLASWQGGAVLTSASASPNSWPTRPNASRSGSLT